MTWWRRSDLQRVRRACPNWHCVVDQDGTLVAMLKGSIADPVICRQGTSNLKTFIELLHEAEGLYEMPAGVLAR